MSERATTRRLLAERLALQRISRPAKSPLEAVRALCAVQAQDYGAGLWAIGLRCQGATLASVEGAIANREVVRSWPPRGTLHFVAAEDLRWMLSLSAPRIVAGLAGRHRMLKRAGPASARRIR